MMKFYDSIQRRRLLLLVLLMVALFGLAFTLNLNSNESETNITTSSSTTQKVTAEPELKTAELVSGLSHPWDMAFLPSGNMLFNERSGSISLFKDRKVQPVAQINDIYSEGEGGLTGLVLDTDFKSNRFIYTCFNSNISGRPDVRVVRFRLSDGEDSLSDRKDIVTGIPSNSSGRHSGCMVRVAEDGTLWVGTGDAAVASNPQSPTSLGGKILHATRDGAPVEGNLSAPYDARIFSFGHRNVQGLALFKQPVEGAYGYSVEHGSDIDDEVNLLKSGNFGWSPRAGYDESGVPMTDLKRFPDAISAVWSSGDSTIAPSGASLISGNKWGLWDGALAMAVLKDKHVRILKFDSKYAITLEKEVLGEFGRVRTVVQGPNGDLYLSTDNGTNDKIIQVTPTTK